MRRGPATILMFPEDNNNTNTTPRRPRRRPCPSLHLHLLLRPMIAGSLAPRSSRSDINNHSHSDSHSDVTVIYNNDRLRATVTHFQVQVQGTADTVPTVATVATSTAFRVVHRLRRHSGNCKCRRAFGSIQGQLEHSMAQSSPRKPLNVACP